MNWGKKISIVIAVFIISMLSMVYVAFQQTNEMMDDHYYEKELKYQSNINAAENLNLMSKATLVAQNKEFLELIIPQESAAKFEKGQIQFVKNDDQKKDLMVTFIPDASGSFRISKSNLFLGYYLMRIQWISAGKSYYREQNIIVK